MRRILLLLVVILFCCGTGKAQYINIPDENFRNYLSAFYPSCFNTSGQMDTTCAEILNEDSLKIFAMDISSYQGLQYFKNLVHFECSNGFGSNPTVIPTFPASLLSIQLNMMYNLASLPDLPPGLEKLVVTNNDNLQNLPVLPAGLKVLSCNQCHVLQSLPALPNGLESLDFSACWQISPPSSFPNSIQFLSFAETGITTVPVLPASLKVLSCGGNPFSELPALPPLLEKLYIASCASLTALPALPATLNYLDCGTCGLTTLPALPAALKYLNCRDNPLTSLPALPNGMTELFCSNNYSYIHSPLGTLPTLPDSLRRLSCGYHEITVLPALPPALEYLDCSMNLLTALPALPANLKTLSAYFNTLQTLPALNDSLQTLDCSSNTLTQLPLLPDSLKALYCSGNQLMMLPPLPGALAWLDCSDNHLTSLPELPGTIFRLFCNMNNIYCLPKIPDFIPSPGNSIFEDRLTLYFDSDKIKCIPNYVPFINFESGSIQNIPLCNPTNNIHQCQSFPVMQGAIFFDNNNNGIKDAGELVKQHGAITLSNGSFTFTDNNGNYEIGADSIGVYSISATAPRYFNTVPAVINYNFTSYDTLVTGNFALQANTVIDELTIRITPINWAARPGFSFPYLISYENTGTTTLTPNIVFDYDETRLMYNTSSVAGVVDNGSSLSLNTGTFLPGQSGNFIGYFTLKTNAVLGDSLKSTVIMSANTYQATDNNTVLIRGAFDPNDKQATPQLSPSQVTAGKYIDYTIRFQNTGTDTAFNIVISDTLNEDLQAGSLQMLAASHTCKATAKDNIVFFEFLNVQLPDSNVNEPKSHGFVSFRIKPQTSVAPNTVIPNKAAIFFDYNAPVITNTAGTLIKDFTVIPLRLVSFSAVPQTDNTTSLYWNTANEINTKKFVIEQSTDGTRFNAVSTVTARGNSSNNYNAVITEFSNGIIYYRLKIVDNDGSFTYSPIIKIDRRKNTAGFSILTNPVKDFIVINTTDQALNNTSCTIISSQGAVVKNFVIKEGSQTIAIKDLPVGIYYVRTMNGSSRLLKQ